MLACRTLDTEDGCVLFTAKVEGPGLRADHCRAIIASVTPHPRGVGVTTAVFPGQARRRVSTLHTMLD